MIFGQDAVHVCDVLAGDLLDDQRSVVGVEEETFYLVLHTPHRGAAGQRNLESMKHTADVFCTDFIRIRLQNDKNLIQTQLTLHTFQ